MTVGDRDDRRIGFCPATFDLAHETVKRQYSVAASPLAWLCDWISPPKIQVANALALRSRQPQHAVPVLGLRRHAFAGAEPIAGFSCRLTLGLPMARRKWKLLAVRAVKATVQWDPQRPSSSWPSSCSV